MPGGVGAECPVEENGQHGGEQRGRGGDEGDPTTPATMNGRGQWWRQGTWQSHMRSRLAMLSSDTTPPDVTGTPGRANRSKPSLPCSGAAPGDDETECLSRLS
jgi:hypothetical protein